MNLDDKLAALNHIEAGVNHLIEKTGTDKLATVRRILEMVLYEIAKNKVDLTSDKDDKMPTDQ